MKASYRWLTALLPGLSISARELGERFSGAGIAVDGIEDGRYEIVADDTSARVLAGLSGGVGALYPGLP